MIKSRFNIALLYMLATVIMMAQWMPLHAHSNARHDHGGALHQHDVEAHAHLQVYAHVQASDVGHNPENFAWVVEINQDQSPANSKIRGNASGVLAFAVRSVPQIPARILVLPQDIDSRSTWPLPRHIGESRAPPLRL